MYNQQLNDAASAEKNNKKIEKKNSKHNDQLCALFQLVNRRLSSSRVN